jgi:hypothetical protein
MGTFQLMIIASWKGQLYIVKGHDFVAAGVLWVFLVDSDTLAGHFITVGMLGLDNSFYGSTLCIVGCSPAQPKIYTCIVNEGQDHPSENYCLTKRKGEHLEARAAMDHVGLESSRPCLGLLKAPLLLKAYLGHWNACVIRKYHVCFLAWTYTKNVGMLFSPIFKYEEVCSKM